jgi:hypothetical protein
MYLDFDDGSGRSIDETIELEDEEISLRIFMKTQ